MNISTLKKSVMEKSRTKKLDHFYSLCTENSTVLDVGVSSNEYNESVNIFHRRFRLNPSQYTGLGTQSMDELNRKYSGKKFIHYEGGVFPFEDNQFDWVFSNAVIEHVGDKSKQLQFVEEMLRVAQNVYFTTPNKYFPVDAHTNVLFRHWFDKHFYSWCEKNNPHWTRENLLLLSKSDLLNLLGEANTPNYLFRSNRVLGMPMTFTVVVNNSINRNIVTVASEEELTKDNPPAH